MHDTTPSHIAPRHKKQPRRIIVQDTEIDDDVNVPPETPAIPLEKIQDEYDFSASDSEDSLYAAREFDR